MPLPFRLTIGLSIFALLAIVDLHRNGKQARRWREYAFLAAVVAIAMLYGILNDQITSAISWEYFYVPSKHAPRSLLSKFRALTCSAAYR